MFPVPRITESFVDAVVESLGWQRYSAMYDAVTTEPNADYISRRAVLELKIFEEEGLEKVERQTKIAELYRASAACGSTVDLDLDQASTRIRRELEALVSAPLQTAVKKASKQIKRTRTRLAAETTGVLVAVNNGYSYLNADTFEKLILRRCQNDSKNIDHAACITIDYHQGDFDAYVFCAVRCHSVRGGPAWCEFDEFQKAVVDAFSAAMTEMMRDQMNPQFRAKSLSPVTDIRFERHGVVYLRRAPDVPDSRG